MRRILPLLILAALTLVAAQALAQESITKLAPEAFGKFQRPPALFAHDKHNEKAKLDECVVCHHGGADGKQDKSASTEGTPCADCHKVKPAGKATGLQRAYHKQCIDCHRAKGKGPLACGQCHKR
ncbi:MAG: cytochrome c family protein [Proteobacteria bacterium]|nr:cytochrome c family protein [Pseudomonadota bacterium]MBU1595810.1 cytochrome c family protein [Pseudomonadota bacterium]